MLDKSHFYRMLKWDKIELHKKTKMNSTKLQDTK